MSHDIVELKCLSAPSSYADTKTRLASMQQLARIYQEGGLDNRSDPVTARGWWQKAIKTGLTGDERATAFLNICAIDEARFRATADGEHKYNILFGLKSYLDKAQSEGPGLASIPLALGQMCQQLGELSLQGSDPFFRLAKGVPESPVFFCDAAEHYETAASMPDREENWAPKRALHALAGLYLNGWGVGKDLIRAAKFHEQAALGGLGIAMIDLAQDYFEGIGADVSPASSEYWLAHALYDEQHGGSLPAALAEIAKQRFVEISEANQSPYPPLARQNGLKWPHPRPAP